MLSQSEEPIRSPRRKWRSFALVLVLALVGGLTLVAINSTPAPNGLGVLPADQSILEQSGVVLQTPTGKPTVKADAAAKAAARQQPGSEPETVLLATAVGTGGSAIHPPGKLCWIVFLNPGSDAEGNAPAPGDIELDVVLVGAHSGSVIEGFIAFRSSTPMSQVGTE
ncbi:MAG: hypothetical protein WBA31_10995 [Candidatus Dormiibacterota bacterium]